MTGERQDEVRGKGRCSECEGAGYRLGSDGEYAAAARCACTRPCQACSGTGMAVRPDERGVPVASRCECMQLDRRVALYNAARIPAKFSGLWIEDLNDVHPSQKEIKYALLKHRDEYRPSDPGYLLWGEPGVGKTHLVCGLLAYLTLERGVSCRFTDIMRLIMDLKAAWSDGQWDNEVLSPVLHAEVLVIDELGKGRNSDFELGILDQLISTRYNAKKTLHCTANYPPVLARTPGGSPYMDGGGTMPQSLQDRLGDRIFSRLNEMCRLFQVQGEDYRMRRFARPELPRRKRTQREQ